MALVNSTVKSTVGSTLIDLFPPRAAVSGPGIVLRAERAGDLPAREALLDEAFGDVRFAKASERLREGRLAAAGLSFVATHHGRLVGTVRLWNVTAGQARSALLLGPLAVSADMRCCGLGGRLMRHALATAAVRGHDAVLLVGDADYYSRFGFGADKTGALAMPGPFEAHRLLGRELRPGALDDARGLIVAAGRPAHRVVARPSQAVARLSRADAMPRAA